MTEHTDTLRPFLWHLGVLNLLNDAGMPTQIWHDAAKADPVTVALIDTGIDTGHPNLDTAIDGMQVDFGPRIAGVVYEYPSTENFARMQALLAQGKDVPARLLKKARAEFANANKAFQPDIDLGANASDLAAAATPLAAKHGAKTWDAALDLTAFGDFAQALTNKAVRQVWDDLARDLARPVPKIVSEDPSRYFGSHGTACAGLIAGRAAAATTDDVPTMPLPLPYRGVNPFCRLRSFATPYSHEILPVVAALVHAYASGAQVIVMPRGVTRPADRAELFADSPYGTRIDTATDAALRPDDHADLAKLTLHWQLLVALLGFVAQRRYLVLAAGNDGFEKELSEPANSLRDDKNVIIVGARSDTGQVSTYSNGRGADDVLYMLSDDAFALDEVHFAVDPASTFGSDFDRTSLGNLPTRSDFSPWGILATDLRGSYGYASATDREEDTGGLYTLFGGTSAASSMMAGLVSLLVQTGGLQPKSDTVSVDRTAVAKAVQDFYPKVMAVVQTP